VLGARAGGLPAPTAAFALWGLLGAVAQIAGTLLLLHLFSLRNFAVGNTFAKTETVQAVLLGLLLLGDRIGLMTLAGILVSLVGLVMLSKAPGLGLFNRGAAIGLACGAGFALAAIGYRAASLALAEGGGLLMRPACTLAYVTLVQSVLLSLWLWRRGGLGPVLREWRIESLVGVAGMLGSLGWFTAFTLVSVAQVKAVGQIELVFSWLTARYAFGERPSVRETLAIALVAGGILLVILG
jgi:drug/metabolite transporter (DMT)-like permease